MRAATTRVRRGLIRRLGLVVAAAALVPALAPTGAGAGAQSAAGLRPTEVDVSDDPSLRYGEPQVVANPTNANNLVVVAASTEFTYACKSANEQKCQLVTSGGFTQPDGIVNNRPGFTASVAFVSFNRGRTWRRVPLPLGASGHPDLVESGHPTATVGPDGTFYLAWNATRFGGRCDYPDPNRPCIPVHHGGVAVTRSTDGGRTWSEPVLAGTPIDHPFITADLSTGRIYVSSGAPGYLGPLSTGDPGASFGAVADRWVASSTDGVHWTSPRPFGGYTGGGAGAAAANFIPFVSAAHGVLATAFRTTSARVCGSAPTPCTVFQTSRDAGVTWSRRVLPVPTSYTGGPLVAADPTRRGRYTIALNMDASTQFSVYQTHDSGRTWSGPTTVTDDATRTHVHSWLAYSPEGALALMWKTNEPGPGPTYRFDVWAAVSVDGGAAFSRPLRISRATSPAPDPGPFGTSLDSLSHMALDRRHAYVVWGDWRPGEERIVFSSTNLRGFR